MKCCKICYTTNSDEAKYCRRCGNKMKSARWYLILPMCLVAILVVVGVVITLCITLGNQGNDYEPPEAYVDDTLEVVPDTSDAYSETGDTMEAYYNTYNTHNYTADSDDDVEAWDTCANE